MANLYVHNNFVMCKACMTRFRIESKEPLLAGLPSYCPHCGSAADCVADPDEDYWYVLAGSFDLPQNEEGAALIRSIYELWEPQDHKRFGDFVKELSNGND